MSEIIWEPHGDYIEKANVTRFMRRHGIASAEELIERSVRDIEWFWAAALEDLDVRWYEPYTRLLDTSRGIEWARWFEGAKTNIILNCLDKHLEAGHGDRTALIFEGEGGDVCRLSYGELSAEVCRVAAAMLADGIGRGDTVGIYMPMCPEIVIALFACLKIGAVAIPVFSGFAARALAVRLADAETRLLFTADGATRRGKPVPLKAEADRAAAEVPTLRRMVVLEKTRAEVPMKAGRDVAWSAFVQGQPTVLETARLAAEELSMILFTSGTTGRPKGTCHTHAGALATIAKELGYAFDVKPGDRFCWVTDIGWMMGPWMMIGVAHHGAAFLITDAPPNYPEPDRLWKMVENHGLTHLGISPTAIRLLMTYGAEWVDRYAMMTLRYLGSTGEPWDPESYRWFFERVGKKRAPIINISGGTEIVGCLLSPLPITALKPCTLRGPGLAMDIDVVDEDGRSLPVGIGHLVCRKPAPSMTKGFLKDPQRYLETYFARFPGIWFHGDWAERDADGYWFLRGRSDDTIKVAGKRTGPAEVEAALIEHAAVSEAAAIGVPHDIKGETVVAFVVLQPRVQPDEALREALKDQVVKHLGKTLRPEDIRFVEAMPKTRSAKIVRGVIRSVYLGETAADLSSVENPSAVDEIRKSR
ncbi:MAG: AMP-binding protein [Planctomycetes bacterium]|nr:AMP-binding protein [Planctomycetota bacterium]